jgi:hypothetical protein
VARSDLKDLIANQAAGGITTRELADLHEYSYEGMRRLLATDDMQARIAEQRTSLMQAGSRAMFRMLLYSDELMAAQVNDALGAGPNQYKARTWILERIIPQRTSSSTDVNVNVAIQQEVFGGLTEALRELRTVNIGGNDVLPEAPRLVDGADALPSLDTATPVEPTGEVPDIAKGNGSAEEVE